MRQEYIQYIKNRILQKPDYKTTLDELRMEMLLAGATEQEFQAALSELETPLPDDPSDTTSVQEQSATETNESPIIQTVQAVRTKIADTSNKTTISKRLLELDLSAHVATGMLMLVLLVFHPHNIHT